ncbi:MAG: RNB domain-containing ribonuclease, partial [Treponema sp.]|nr:RNB domain-containing ribonuclease [Treponema sp.]
MLSKNSLVLYKSNAAVVVERDGEKYLIRWCSTPATNTGKKAVYSEQKVREKDFIVLSESPCSSLEKVLDFALSSEGAFETGLSEAYELFMSDNQTSGVPLDDIFEMAAGSLDADKIFAVYQAVKSSLLFYPDEEAYKNGELKFNLRTEEEIALLKQKLDEKEHA